MAFYIGVWTGINAASPTPEGAEAQTLRSAPPCPKNNNNLDLLSDNAELQRKVEALAKQKVKAQLEDLCSKLPSSKTTTMPDAPQKGGGKPQQIKGQLFSKSIEHFARGLVRVSKDDLMKEFAFGVPPNANTEGLDALILYNKEEALPSDQNIARAARYEDPTKPLPLVTAKTATENCDTMNVIFIDNPGNTRQCFALVGSQYQKLNMIK